jgi:hypothetical protein
MKMSKEKIVYLTGPIMFAKVFENNRDRGTYAPDGGQYTVDIGLTKESYKMARSWNKRYQAKEYDDERYGDMVDDSLQYLQFKRKHIVTKRDGEVIEEWSGPPAVKQSDNTDWEDKGMIGNGSKCTVKLAVFNGTFTNEEGKQAPYTTVRLEAIRVDDWVQYDAPGSGGGDEEDDSEERPF